MLFSIIMPVYMVENYIEKSIQSVVHQTNKDFEVILVNDGTRDGSIEKAKNVLVNTDISYSVVNQENKGVSSARNAGIKAAKGEWIVCMDPDDCIHPQTLEFIQQVLEKESGKANVITFNYTMCRSQVRKYLKYDNLPDYSVFSPKEAGRLYLDRELRFIAPAFFIRRKVCIEKGFLYNSDTIYSEDTLYIWNVIASMEPICYIHVPLYYYLIRPKSTMTSSNQAKVLNGYRAYLEFDSKMREKIVFDEQIYILPRWILGVMHSASKYMDFRSYRELLKALDYKNHIKVLKKCHNKKVRIVAWMVSVLGSASFFVLKIR